MKNFSNSLAWILIVSLLYLILFTPNESQNEKRKRFLKQNPKMTVNQIDSLIISIEREKLKYPIEWGAW